jgi:hypothetical protein
VSGETERLIKAARALVTQAPRCCRCRHAERDSIGTLYVRIAEFTEVWCDSCWYGHAASVGPTGRPLPNSPNMLGRAALDLQRALEPFPVLQPVPPVSTKG